MPASKAKLQRKLEALSSMPEKQSLGESRHEQQWQKGRSQTNSPIHPVLVVIGTMRPTVSHSVRTIACAMHLIRAAAIL